MTLRLIADENISWRLKRALPNWDVLPSNEIKQGTRLTDIMIWQFAKVNTYSILTSDENFSEIQNLYGLRFLKFLNNEELGIYEIYSWV
jgi:predicted nuclease of predicted toxin-antitoxin system